MFIFVIRRLYFLRHLELHNKRMVPLYFWTQIYDSFLSPQQRTLGGTATFLYCCTIRNMYIFLITLTQNDPAHR